MRGKRLLLAVLSLTFAFISTGCIEIQRTITIAKDFSGQATFQMAIDMDAILHWAAEMEHKMTGKPGAVTEQELEEARKELLGEMASEMKGDAKADIAPLPAGFTLVSATKELIGMSAVMRVTVKADDIRKIDTLVIDDNGTAPVRGMPGDNMRPFEGVVFKEAGETVEVTAKLVTAGLSTPKPTPSPAPGDKPTPAGVPPRSAKPPEDLTQALNELIGQMGSVSEMKEMVEGMMKGFREVLRIETPMTIVETNATKREGAMMTWDYGMQALIKAKAEPDWKQPTIKIKK